MTIDSNLLKQAIYLQRQVGRESWMEDISTIKAMRSKKVDWSIIYTLIVQKHSLEMSQEIFEQRASSMLRSIAATSTRKKKRRVSNAVALIEHHKTESSGTDVQPSKIDADQADFQSLDKTNPIA